MDFRTKKTNVSRSCNTIKNWLSLYEIKISIYVNDNTIDW